MIKGEHTIFKASCCFTKALCRMSNLRNGHVAVSNVVVQTHKGPFGGILTLLREEKVVCIYVHTSKLHCTIFQGSFKDRQQ